MNIAPTCPKCLRPYWDDGSQTAVQICKCVDHTLPPPSLIVNNDMRILNLLEEINKKLDKIVRIPLDAEVKPEIAESIKKQLKENQLMDNIEVVQCMGDPFGIMLPTHILLKNSKEEKWYRQTV